MSDVSPIPRRFIEEAGNTTQALGLGRVIGQLYAFLYFSEPPRTLDDMKEALGISKGSASMGVRQLEQWGAVKRIWVKGDRKDYYTANDYFGQIIRNLLADLMGKRLSAMAQVVDAAEQQLLNGPGDQAPGDDPPGSAFAAARQSGDDEFLRARVRALRGFQRKVERTLRNPVVKMMLK